VCYGHSGHGGGRDVASRCRETSAVHYCNSSDDDSDNDDPDYEDTRVVGDVNGDNSDDVGIINEGSLDDIVVPLAKIIKHDHENVYDVAFLAYNYDPPFGPHGEIF
jgi:hypothetical protein